MNYEELGRLLTEAQGIPETGMGLAREFGVPRITARMALAWKAGWDARTGDVRAVPSSDGTVELSGPYKVDDLIVAAGLDPKEWSPEKVVTNCWTTTLRVNTTTVKQVPNYQTKATLVKIPTEILTAPRVLAEIPEPKWAKTPLPPTETERVLFVPDMQVGFVWSDRHRKLVPYHDWDAIAAVIQLAHETQPHRIIFLGDNADLPALSRYAKGPEMVETTAPSLHALHAIYAAFRSACPDARMTYHLGNHEARLARYLGENASELLRLESPDGTLLLGWDNLLGLKELQVERIGDYGDIEWLWGELKVHHGNVHASGGGGTSTKVAKTAAYSECFGHTHKVELVNKRVEGPEGPRLLTIFSPGTLARTDIDSPLPRFAKVADFQQGCAVATRTPSGHTDYQVMNIWNGEMVHGGKVYKGEGAQLAAWVADTMDWPQMRVTP